MQTEERTKVRNKTPPVLFSKTQKVIREIEAALGHTLISYWTSRSGSVCHNDAIGMYELLSKVGRHECVSMFIKSDGGSGQAALRIINLLREHTGRLLAVVPLECASAATMLALGADEIHMGPLAYLTAIDTSIRHDLSPVDIDNDLVSVSHDELVRVVNLWRSETTDRKTNPYQHLYQYVHPLVVGAVDRASSLSIKLCQEIMSYHMTDQEKIARISQSLNGDYPSHSYPITLREARRIGLQVAPLDERINALLLELHELYSEMGQKAVTDYDETKYHNNEILNIMESRDVQIFYQVDKDWHYRKEERRWVPLNDESSWRKLERANGRVKRSVVHIR